MWLTVSLCIFSLVRPSPRLFLSDHWLFVLEFGASIQGLANLGITMSPGDLLLYKVSGPVSHCFWMFPNFSPFLFFPHSFIDVSLLYCFDSCFQILVWCIGRIKKHFIDAFLICCEFEQLLGFEVKEKHFQFGIFISRFLSLPFHYLASNTLSLIAPRLQKLHSHVISPSLSPSPRNLPLDVFYTSFRSPPFSFLIFVSLVFLSVCFCLVFSSFVSFLSFCVANVCVLMSANFNSDQN